MRTLHVIGTLSPVIGGPAKAAFDMARAEVRNGNRVSIFTTDDRAPEGPAEKGGTTVIRDGVTIRFFPLGFPGIWQPSWAMAAALRREIKSFDLVIIHSLYLFHDLVAGHVCRKAGVPYVVRPHGSLDPYIYRRHRWRKAVAEFAFNDRLLRGAVAMLYTSEDEKRLAAPYSFGRPPIVVPLGIEVDDYHHLPPPGLFRERYPETKGRRIVMFLARLHPKKGLGILIEAFDRATKIHPDLHLVLAGPDGGMEKQVRQWLRQRHLEDRVTLTGMLTGDIKFALLQDSDVFVLPSYSENFGIAVVEAMYFGMPILLSDQVNVWREVVGAGAGLASPCDPDAFSKILMKVLASPDDARKMGQQGHALALRDYTWGNIGRVLVRSYERILSARSAAAAGRDVA